ncbi:MAG: hypothetical protein LUQ65_03560 [Candidatus Helarchaeota archaeon]|nr:hypothetical protein [Candidatus Helarchaeota archaeon]
MPPEKLGFFRKLFAKLGKRLYWKMSSKMNLYMLSSMAYGVTKYYEEIFKGDTGMAVDTFTTQFVNGASSIMYELLPRMNFFFSKSLVDIKLFSDVAMYVIMGPKWRRCFGEPIVVPAEKSEEGVPQLILHFTRCVLCTGLKPGVDIDQSKLKEKSYGELLASAFSALLQLIQDYVGNEYTLEVKEVKCMLRGDPYGECIVSFLPKKKAES